MYFLGYIGYIYDTDMDNIPYTAIMLLEGCFFMCQGNDYEMVVDKTKMIYSSE